MITQFKEFDNNYTSLKVGDYIIIDPSEFTDRFFVQEVSNEICVITKIRDIENDDFPIEVKFSKKLPIYDRNVININVDEILYHSKNREDLEVMVDTKKYNL